jgi:hypothetical protein
MFSRRQHADVDLMLLLLVPSRGAQFARFVFSSVHSIDWLFRVDAFLFFLIARSARTRVF